MLKSEILYKLREIVGTEGVLTSEENLNAYSYDSSAVWKHVPEVVVLPATKEQVSSVFKLANENRIPVTPRGGGTNVSGGSVPIEGGIVLCSTRMNRILEINRTNLTTTVEAGVVLNDLNLALTKQNLFFPPDPQSFMDCTIGGNAAENAGGPYCVKYGVFKQYVLGIEVVLPDGQIMKLGGVTAKNRTGYEIMMLFIGSEGTLGMITQLTLRLIPLPSANQTMIAIFDDMEKAGQAISDVMAGGIIPAKVEFVNNFIIKRIEEMLKLGLPTDAQVLLLLQTDGSPAAVSADTEQIVNTLKKSGARVARAAHNPEEAAMFWKARSAGFAAIRSAAKTLLGEDVTVPRDKLAEFIHKLGDISKKSGFAIQFVGHAGDGNLHPSIATDINNKEHFNRAQEVVEEIVKTALDLGGVLSGEHGIGLEKKRFLKLAMAPPAIELMKKIKTLFDPNGIMNPGKIWEE